MKNILEIQQLTVQAGQKKILDDVSFKIAQGTITALVGASGSGKSTIAHAIMRLLPPKLTMVQGRIVFDGQDILELPQEHMRLLRGSQISMVFQDPLAAFNPLMSIGEQIEELIAVHTNTMKQDRKQLVLDALTKVRVSNPLEVYHRYPHQLSGGQRQRAMLAQALMAKPKLIIADEPTSNLDVTMQVQIMELLRFFKKDGMTILLISHDLGMVSHLADDAVILENGHVVEAGLVISMMKNPKHPYTKSLLEAFV